jgi:hypothetical protein
MNKQICMMVLLLCSMQLLAQKPAKRSKLYIVPQLGLINGDRYVSGQVALVGGKEKDGWGIGIGAAVDYYKLRTLPVFVDVRKNITNADWPVFAYANFGVNIPAPLETQTRVYSPWYNTSDSRYQAGLYTDLGLGYAMLNKKHRGFVMSIGFSSKGNTEKYMETIYNDFPPYKANQYERKLSYSFNRVILKLGFRLYMVNR